MWFVTVSVFLGLVLLIIMIVLIWYVKNSENRMQETVLKQGQEFLQKTDFLFNRFFQSREESSRETVRTLAPISSSIDVMRNRLEEFSRNTISRDGLVAEALKKFIKQHDDIVQIATKLEREAQNMRLDFKQPKISGSLGELQLERIVRAAGLLSCCVQRQVVFEGARPDMVIKLPKGGHIMIDAKAPMDSFIKLIESENPAQEVKLQQELIKTIKTHVTRLSNKEYWKKDFSPEFTVMVIPHERILFFASEQDPELWSFAMERNVIITTPMTLAGLLKTIALGWEQVSVTTETEKLKTKMETIKTKIKDVVNLFEHAVELHEKYRKMTILCLDGLHELESHFSIGNQEEIRSEGIVS